MEKKKYYYTYVILCTEGSFKGKLYFGKHETYKLDDNYLGSGKLIKRYINKYPLGYIKEIIAFYNSSEELCKAEYDLIHPHLGKDYCLNISEGGRGCICYGENNGMHGKTMKDVMTEEQYNSWYKNLVKSLHRPCPEYKKNLLSEKFKGRYVDDNWRTNISISTKKAMNDPEVKERNRLSKIGKKDNDETKLKKSKSRKEYLKTHQHPCLGYKHKKEARNNMSNSRKEYYKTHTHHSLGTHRVYDNPEHTKWHMEKD